MMAMHKPPDAGDILQGTLDMIILRIPVLGPAHGHTITQAIERTSEYALEVEQGSLYPAQHCLEDRRLVSSEYGVSESNPESEVLSVHGQRQKELNAATGRWRRMTRAIGLFFGESFE